MDPTQIAAWLPVVNTMGVIVILVFIVGAFVRGLLWPKHMVDRTLLEQRKAGEIAARETAKAVGGELAQTMEHGIDRILSKLDTQDMAREVRKGGH